MTDSSANAKKFENIIKQSEVINQTLFDAVTMEELGRIEVLWMYPQINRVLGFVSKSGFLGTKKAAFKLPQLESIGTNGILVKGEGEPTVAAKVKQLESLIHSEVWSESGDRIGYIIDCLFNYRSGVIVRYLMVPSRLGSITEGVYFLSPKAIKSFGRQRVLIYADAAETLKPYRKGWKYKLADARDTFREEYVNEVRGELSALAQKVQGFSKDAMNRVEHWGDRLRDETQVLIEQAKERSQAFYEKARASGQSIFDQIRTEGLSFNDHMQNMTSRVDSDFSQNVTFPEGDDAEVSATTDAYHHESWDDDWNDWEEEQDAHRQRSRGQGQNNKPDDERSINWADSQDAWVGQDFAGKTSAPDNADDGILGGTGDRHSVTSNTPEQSVDESPHAWGHEADIWDDDWVNDDASFNTEPLASSAASYADSTAQEEDQQHYASQDSTLPSKTPPVSAPNTNREADEDDDPWI